MQGLPQQTLGSTAIPLKSGSMDAEPLQHQHSRACRMVRSSPPVRLTPVRLTDDAPHRDTPVTRRFPPPAARDTTAHPGKWFGACSPHSQRHVTPLAAASRSSPHDPR
jgi:hypothetical protein